MIKIKDFTLASKTVPYTPPAHRYIYTYMSVNLVPKCIFKMHIYILDAEHIQHSSKNLMIKVILYLDATHQITHSNSFIWYYIYSWNMNRGFFCHGPRLWKFLVCTEKYCLWSGKFYIEAVNKKLSKTLSATMAKSRFLDGSRKFTDIQYVPFNPIIFSCECEYTRISLH